MKKPSSVCIELFTLTAELDTIRVSWGHTNTAHNTTTRGTMKSSHQMFLRRNSKRGHESVLVLIDWSGVSDKDLRMLAAHYVVNRAAHDLKDYEERLPESVEYRAADFVHTEPLVQKDYVIPKSWTAPAKKSKARKELEELLEGLSPEERRILLSQ